MDQRGAVTDQLADVIRIAQLVHKTGTLIVERDGGSAGLEEGRITFVEGRVTEATAGRMSGQKAFDWLNTWGTCRFVFVPSLPSSSALLQSSMQGLTRNTDRLTPPPVSASVGTVPYRIRDVNEVLPLFGSMGLTRAHRQLFLLIDGQRSVSDLVRLSARGAEETRKLLSDLERAGLIQQ
jgi:Domain of unknown function (DUF4388)